METTLVKADKQLVSQAHELGANVKRVVDLALGDFIQRNKPIKRSSGSCNGGENRGNPGPKPRSQRWCGRRDSNPRRELGKLVS